MPSNHQRSALVTSAQGGGVSTFSRSPENMGMICNIARISNEIRIHLLSHPEDIHSFIYGDSEVVETLVPRRGILGALGFKAKKVEYIDKDGPVGQLADKDQFDIDKSWHSMHFLFSGSAWEGEFPSSFILSGGDKVGDEDVGYGEARVFTVEDTETILSFLKTMDEEELLSRFDSALMKENEIYPNIWDREEDLKDNWIYVKEWLDSMIEFISSVVADKKTIMIYIN